MHRLVASWFGSGLLVRRIRGTDMGSGTVGALFAAIPAYFLYRQIEWPYQVVAAAVVLLASLWSVSALAADHGDAGWIVVDEAAGAFIALIGLGLWPGAVVAFVVFRAADIFKRFAPGVAAADRGKGSTGITADDVIAGLYGLAAGHLAQALFV